MRKGEGRIVKYWEYLYIYRIDIKSHPIQMLIN